MGTASFNSIKQLVSLTAVPPTRVTAQGETVTYSYTITIHTSVPCPFNTGTGYRDRG